jgi:hypothetical protein
MGPEQQPPALAVAAELAQDEGREADPAFGIERSERVPAEDVCDLHDRPPPAYAPGTGACGDPCRKELNG